MKKAAMIVFVIAIGIVLALGSDVSAKEASFSGFLGDYSQLKPDPEGQAALIYRAPPEKLRQYKKFIIDPVSVHFAPNAKGTTVSPRNLNKLTDYFEEELTKTLSESGRYMVVKAPGTGVLRIRVAITDIKKTKTGWNILPQTKLIGLGLGGASFEAEAVDSMSGERVAAVVDTEKGSRLSVSAGLKKFGDAEYVMKQWAHRLVKRLDEIHGY